MKIVVRADASLQIGTGHIMRCLTLAEALKQQGAEISFICRAHQGNLISIIEDKGFKVFTLNVPEHQIESLQDEALSLFHAKWLGVSQQQDADECRDILEQIKPDWLIVDHYAIDQAWQKALQGCYKKLMVIDDLADRKHQCDLLLDQTYGREPQDYQHLVPENCQMLLGSQYALLRPEFAKWRESSLKRRTNSEFKQLLITMGGIDPDNVTGQVLEAISHINLPNEIAITVVMGGAAPHLTDVKKQAQTMAYKTQVIVDVTNMAEIMANVDFAIGAAGATTWERCALGLPSIMLVLAQNQKNIAYKVGEADIAIIANRSDLQSLIQFFPDKQKMRELVSNSSTACDGRGVHRVINYFL
ncbi:MAG: UDP-2,4-diacetamido-2,4,6-trideoxy-beta-L-altropyranose hydrolase [Pseudomonadota bacterium]|nr:UDP-2,4-diacetamido-2,4,6-trideoxy-beta-L-altropyranose hydrolase [Pseudomonadota bacterium]